MTIRTLVTALLVGSAVMLGTPGVAAAAPALPIVPGETVGDRVHISGSLPPTASAHGWWTYAEPTDFKADVTIQLQIRRGDTWADVGAVGVKRVFAGGGSANRANARVVCTNLESNEWRSVIDVDIIGVIDTPEKLYTQVQRLTCRA